MLAEFVHLCRCIKRNELQNWILKYGNIFLVFMDFKENSGNAIFTAISKSHYAFS